MNVDEIIQEAESILDEAKRVECARIARERKERRHALYSAAGFCALVAGSLLAVYGIVALVFKLIIR